MRLIFRLGLLFDVRRPTRRGLPLVLALLGLLGPATTARAIVFGTEPDTDDTRYDAVGAFSFAKWLGQVPADAAPNTQDHNWFCTATLVDANHVMTATHCTDAAS
ncbi:MAG: trypsin-like serine protease, partial [Deltaproteobacteria bacterium]|nr:trypsin-like serine protease [Deltaproteobacteria bacterium]